MDVSQVWTELLRSLRTLLIGTPPLICDILFHCACPARAATVLLSMGQCHYHNAAQISNQPAPESRKSHCRSSTFHKVYEVPCLGRILLALCGNYNGICCFRDHFTRTLSDSSFCDSFTVFGKACPGTPKLYPTIGCLVFGQGRERNQFLIESHWFVHYVSRNTNLTLSSSIANRVYEVVASPLSFCAIAFPPNQYWKSRFHVTALQNNEEPFPVLSRPFCENSCRSSEIDRVYKVPPPRDSPCVDIV